RPGSCGGRDSHPVTRRPGVEREQARFAIAWDSEPAERPPNKASRTALDSLAAPVDFSRRVARRLRPRGGPLEFLLRLPGLLTGALRIGGDAVGFLTHPLCLRRARLPRLFVAFRSAQHVLNLDPLLGLRRLAGRRASRL